MEMFSAQNKDGIDEGLSTVAGYFDRASITYSESVDPTHGRRMKGPFMGKRDQAGQKPGVAKDRAHY